MASLIYLASPYGHEDEKVRLERYYQVLYKTKEMLEKGLHVFSPIVHNHYINELSVRYKGWADWMAFDFNILERCDALWVLTIEGHQQSVGVQAEIAFANSNGIPVIYTGPAGVERKRSDSQMNQDVQESVRKGFENVPEGYEIVPDKDFVYPSYLVWNWASERWANFDAANPFMPGCFAAQYQRPIARPIGDGETAFASRSDMAAEMFSPHVSQTYIKQALYTESQDFDRQRETLNPDYTMRMFHATMGLTTETGELMDMMKRHIIYGLPFDVINAKEELGDILWYVALFANALGLQNLDEIMKMNLDKLALRYKGKFSTEAITNKDLEGERALLEMAHLPPEAFKLVPNAGLPSESELPAHWKDEDEEKDGIRKMLGLPDDALIQKLDWSPADVELMKQQQQELTALDIPEAVRPVNVTPSALLDETIEPSSIELVAAPVTEDEAQPMIDLEKTSMEHFKNSKPVLFEDLAKGDWFKFYEQGAAYFKKDDTRYAPGFTKGLTESIANPKDEVIRIAKPVKEGRDE